MARTMRYLRRRHLPEVLEIDHDSFGLPWGGLQFAPWTWPGRAGCSGLVVVDGGFVVGYMLCQMKATHYELQRVAVAPDCRRQGHGAAMLAHLVGRLSGVGRQAVRLSVPEGLTSAHLWLRACGFTATGVVRRGLRDEYTFECRIAAEIPATGT